ncbi:MAG TPA: hypothetical protein DD733_07215 [Clostridiales bacterium]|nr:hypothetical protein [Clostridiales bacterium]
MCNICECLFGRRRFPRPEIVNIYPNRELEDCLRERRCCIIYQQFCRNCFPCSEFGTRDDRKCHRC